MKKREGKGSKSVLGVEAIVIQKSSSEEVLLRRLREYLLFSKLKSLLPPLPSSQMTTNWEAVEYEPSPIEIPTGDSDEDNPEATSTEIEKNEEVEEEDEVFFEEEIEKPFVPSIKIKRIDGILLISTIVLKEAALTSALFHALEEEKLDIVSENQYRTETKVAHSIQVRVEKDYDVDALEKKLCIWAGKQI